jgi:hypothetical protein
MDGADNAGERVNQVQAIHLDCAGSLASISGNFYLYLITVCALIIFLAFYSDFTG